MAHFIDARAAFCEIERSLYASIAQAYQRETVGEDSAVVRSGVDSVHLV